MVKNGGVWFMLFGMLICKMRRSRCRIVSRKVKLFGRSPHKKNNPHQMWWQFLLKVKNGQIAEKWIENHEKEDHVHVDQQLGTEKNHVDEPH